jgi:hypothetical protein
MVSNDISRVDEENDQDLLGRGNSNFNNPDIETIQTQLFEPLSSNDDDTLLKNIIFQKQPNDEDVFMVEIPCEEEIQSVLFFHSYSGFLKQFTQYCINQDQ